MGELLYLQRNQRKCDVFVTAVKINCLTHLKMNLQNKTMVILRHCLTVMQFNRRETEKQNKKQQPQWAVRWRSAGNRLHTSNSSVWQPSLCPAAVSPHDSLCAAWDQIDWLTSLLKHCEIVCLHHNLLLFCLCSRSVCRPKNSGIHGIALTMATTGVAKSNWVSRIAAFKGYLVFQLHKAGGIWEF